MSKWSDKYCSKESIINEVIEDFINDPHIFVIKSECTLDELINILKNLTPPISTEDKKMRTFRTNNLGRIKPKEIYCPIKQIRETLNSEYIIEPVVLQTNTSCTRSPYADTAKEVDWLSVWPNDKGIAEIYYKAKDHDFIKEPKLIVDITHLFPEGWKAVYSVKKKISNKETNEFRPPISLKKKNLIDNYTIYITQYNQFDCVKTTKILNENDINNLPDEEINEICRLLVSHNFSVCPRCYIGTLSDSSVIKYTILLRPYGWQYPLVTGDKDGDYTMTEKINIQKDAQTLHDFDTTKYCVKYQNGNLVSKEITKETLNELAKNFPLFFRNLKIKEDIATDLITFSYKDQELGEYLFNNYLPKNYFLKREQI